MPTVLRRLSALSALLLTSLTVCVTFQTQAQAQTRDTFVPCRRFMRQVECIAVPLADAAADAAAKQFAAPGGNTARIYLARPGNTDPKQKSDVYLDGKRIGTLAPQTYMVIDTTAGEHRIAADNRAEGAISVTVASQETVYVQQRSTLWFNTQTIAFKTVDARKGQTDITASHLVATDTSANTVATQQ